jgi:hypothetical protein
MGDNSEFDVGAATAAPGEFEAVSRLIDEGLALKEKVEQLEGDLKAAKAALQSISTTRLPEAMTALQLTEFVRNGWKVKVAPFVNGSLPKELDKRKAAINWLVNHDGGGLIKTDIECTFGREQFGEAEKLMTRLIKAGYEPKMEVGVHAQTLCAFARERLASGEQIDFEVLGLFTGNAATYKRVKE